MVDPGGVEPPTSPLSAERSHHLSYGSVWLSSCSTACTRRESNPHITRLSTWPLSQLGYECRLPKEVWRRLESNQLPPGFNRQLIHMSYGARTSSVRTRCARRRACDTRLTAPGQGLEPCPLGPTPRMLPLHQPGLPGEAGGLQLGLLSEHKSRGARARGGKSCHCPAPLCASAAPCCGLS